MKLLRNVLPLVLIFSFINHAFASECLDISYSLSRYQESSAILRVQNFLFEKGYLTATPNGYFGAGTFAAVKAYQKQNGVSQVGAIGPATRALLKRDTCTSSSTTTQQSSATTQTTTQTQITQTNQTPIQTVVATPPVITSRNQRRFDDLDKILKALYMRSSDMRGVYPVSPSATSTEMCVAPPYVMPTGTATEMTVLVTPVSPCLSYADISVITPQYLAVVPRDPTLATSSTLLGYTIQRSDYNDITLQAKYTDDQAIIKVRCNFNAGCGKIDHISSIEYSSPSIVSIDRPIFLMGSSPKDPITITGKGFTTKNKVYLFSNYTSREYYLGEYISANTGTTIAINGNDLNQYLSCGTGCSQKLPLGDYTLTVKNEGGTSNASYMSLKSYTASSISVRADATVLPKTKGVKVGTLTISSSVPIKLNSIVFTSTSTSPNLASKISNFILKDPSNGTSYAPGSLGGVTIYENQSKLYDLYVDVDDVLVADAGYITFGGVYEAVDVLTGETMYLPSKEISFTVSY